MIVAIILLILSIAIFVMNSIEISKSEKADMKNYKYKLKESLKIAKAQLDQDNSDYYDALYKAKKMYYNALKKETKNNEIIIVDEEHDYKKALYEKAIEDINQIHLSNSNKLSKRIAKLEQMIELFSD